MEPKEFAEYWRIKHGEPLSYIERVVNSACDIIIRQDKRIDELTEELDAECRVSQMLLAEIKRLKALKGNNMFIIRRTEVSPEKQSKTAVIHETLDEVQAEADRLCKKHAEESPEFKIYVLKEIATHKHKDIALGDAEIDWSIHFSISK